MNLVNSDLAICLGVSLNDVYLLLLDQDEPFSLLTRRRMPGKEFEVGKWYIKSGKSKQYQIIDDVLPTNPVQRIDDKSAGMSKIELLLPVFFPPDLANISDLGFSHAPSFKDLNLMNTPICPLFGLDATNKCLSPVKWLNGHSRGIYSNELYELKATLSFKIGGSPEWISQNVVSQLKPWKWDQNQSTIVHQLCMESRVWGLMVSSNTCTHPNMKGLCYNFILDKQGKLMIALSQEDKQIISPGEYRQYWPIEISSTYDFPVVIALNCPQNGHILEEGVPFPLLQELDTFKFNVNWEINPFNGADSPNYSIEWLGKVMDEFRIIDNKASDEPVVVVAYCHLHLATRSAAWVLLVDCIINPPKIAAINHKIKRSKIPNVEYELINRIPSSNIISKVNDIPDMANDIGKYSSSAASNEISTSKLNLAYDIPSDANIAIAAFMAIRLATGEAVFLIWDQNKGKFTQRYYAIFHESLNFDMTNFGKWFELKYVISMQSTIFIHHYTETHASATTRVRDGICAQFLTTPRFLPVWHSIFPCHEKNNYYEDNGWWPLLCRKCFPGLRELSPPIGQQDSFSKNNGATADSYKTSTSQSESRGSDGCTKTGGMRKNSSSTSSTLSLQTSTHHGNQSVNTATPSIRSYPPPAAVKNLLQSGAYTSQFSRGTVSNNVPLGSSVANKPTINAYANNNRPADSRSPKLSVCTNSGAKTATDPNIANQSPAESTTPNEIQYRYNGKD